MKSFFVRLFVLAVLSFDSVNLWAQELQWHDPLATDGVLEGRGWEDIGYNRLPDDAQAKVREPVWNLSRDATGLLLRFTTDADQVQVTFVPGKKLSMPHMPTTGVSGLDLYSRAADGEWLWVRGRYDFSEEKIAYSFLTPNSTGEEREYQLYLPLYNSVSDLKIGTASSAKFTFLPKRPENPIVIYGTSIAQGACASRAGMSWPNILGRSLDKPLINLAFSGNGRMEPELIEYIETLKASVYVLDCLPNLGPGGGFTEEIVRERITHAIQALKAAQPDTPILLVEHDGYSDGGIDPARKEIYTNLNLWTKAIFEDLIAEGIEDLYLMTREDIGLGMDDYVDGTHPTDLGMQRYADAYIKHLTKILD